MYADLLAFPNSFEVDFQTNQYQYFTWSEWISDLRNSVTGLHGTPLLASLVSVFLVSEYQGFKKWLPGPAPVKDLQIIIRINGLTCFSWLMTGNSSTDRPSQSLLNLGNQTMWLLLFTRSSKLWVNKCFREEVFASSFNTKKKCLNYSIQFKGTNKTLPSAKRPCTMYLSV